MAGLQLKIEKKIFSFPSHPILNNFRQVFFPRGSFRLRFAMFFLARIARWYLIGFYSKFPMANSIERHRLL